MGAFILGFFFLLFLCLGFSQVNSIEGLQLEIQKVYNKFVKWGIPIKNLNHSKQLPFSCMRPNQILL